MHLNRRKGESRHGQEAPEDFVPGELKTEGPVLKHQQDGRIHVEKRLLSGVRRDMGMESPTPLTTVD